MSASANTKAAKKRYDAARKVHSQAVKLSVISGPQGQIAVDDARAAMDKAEDEYRNHQRIDAAADRLNAKAPGKPAATAPATRKPSRSGKKRRGITGSSSRGTTSAGAGIPGRALSAAGDAYSAGSWAALAWTLVGGLIAAAIFSRLLKDSGAVSLTLKSAGRGFDHFVYPWTGAKTGAGTNAKPGATPQAAAPSKGGAATVPTRAVPKPLPTASPTPMYV